MTDYEVVDSRPTRTPKPIDYSRMRRENPKQMRKLKKAVEANDAVKVANVCIETVKMWDEVGAWPDDWSALQRALDDVLPWNQQVMLDDVAYGRVKIEYGEN